MNIDLIEEPIQIPYTDTAVLIGMAYVTPRVLGSGKNMMIGNLIELQIGHGRNWPIGVTLSTLLLLIVLASLVVYTRVSSKEDPHGQTPRFRHHPQADLPPAFHPRKQATHG